MEINGYKITPFADLGGANLSGADLHGANLRGVNLRYADLSGAYLRYADLRYADLNGTYLRYADLRYADLSGAYLNGARLRGANLSNTQGLEQTYIVPETGSFDAWKKCNFGVLVKLRIPAEAKRSNATGRKCRAEFVKVLDVIGAEIGITNRAGRPTQYVKGETVSCDNWCDDRWQECAGGIHFFMTRKEAENW